MLQQFLKDYVTWERPHAGIGKEWEGVGAVEELLWTDLPSGSRRGHRGMRTQGVEPGKKGEGVGDDVFHFAFVFHNSYVFL